MNTARENTPEVLNAVNEYGKPTEVPKRCNPSHGGVYYWSEVVRCPRCGGSGRYVTTVDHGACYQCMGERTINERRYAYTPEAYAKKAKRAEARRAKAMREDAAKWEARDAQLMGLIGLSAEQLYDCLLMADAPVMFYDLRLKADKPLSEKQQSALIKWMEGFERMVNRVPPPVMELEVGKRINVTARCVSAKYVDGAYGSTLKGLFVVEIDGSQAKIYMTVPTGMDGVGEAGEIAVTLEPSNDKGFYFGKRPKLVIAK